MSSERNDVPHSLLVLLSPVGESGSSSFMSSLPVIACICADSCDCSRRLLKASADWTEGLAVGVPSMLCRVLVRHHHEAIRIGKEE